MNICRTDGTVCPVAGHIGCPAVRKEVEIALARHLLYVRHMKNLMKITAARNGSIALEYVIVLCGLGVALVIFVNRVFYNPGEGFGPLGQLFVAFYQRLQGGLSLPVP